LAVRALRRRNKRKPCRGKFLSKTRSAFMRRKSIAVEGTGSSSHELTKDNGAGRACAKPDLADKQAETNTKFCAANSARIRTDARKPRIHSGNSRRNGHPDATATTANHPVKRRSSFSR